MWLRVLFVAAFVVGLAVFIWVRPGCGENQLCGPRDGIPEECVRPSPGEDVIPDGVQDVTVDGVYYWCYW